NGPAAGVLDSLPASLSGRIKRRAEWGRAGAIAAVLVEGGVDAIWRAVTAAATATAILPVHAVSPEGLAAETEDYPLDRLVEERHVSINTAAAGGNASLMTIG
ncbi:MAG TPA: hypothetical protein VGO82_01500, partial [Enterovirga sp.]|nr:hypothetical protein [Enterovirga sp.]